MTTKRTYEELMSIELDNEIKYKGLGEAAILKAMRDATKNDRTSTGTPLGKMFFSWKAHKLKERIQDWVEYNLNPKSGCKSSYYRIIKDLAKVYTNVHGDVDLEKMCSMLSSITLATVINVLGHCTNREHCYINNLGYNLSEYIEHEYHTMLFEKWVKLPENEEYAKFLKGVDYRVGYHYRKIYLERTFDKCKFPMPTAWGEDKKAQGAFGNVLLRFAQDITDYFTLQYIWSGSKSKREVEYMIPTPEFNEKWGKNEENIIDHAYKVVPMVVCPKDWVSYDEGGYWGVLAPFNKMLRLKETGTLYAADYMSRLKELDLTPIKNVANSMQSTQWKVNTDVLSVLQSLWKLGYCPCGKEKEKGHVILISPTDEKPEYPEGGTEEEIKSFKKKAVKYYKRLARMSSLINRAKAIIEMAEEFKDFESIYFPHNFDFRGRIYPIPNGLSPQGDDLAKGLLLFSNPPACTSEDDLDYLAIIGANLAGVDKVSYADRIKWVKDNESYILAVANDPLECKWWLSVDKKPTQLLAWCFEWAKAKKYIEEHGSIIGFVTGVPYAQDGTCSGLQHFSAILRDPVGGQAVNLVPQDKPNDIYRQVSDKVNVLLKRDAVNGEPDHYDEKKKRVVLGSKAAAQLWLNFGVNRSTCKRGCMTLAYGATKAGFKDQIFEDTIKPYLDAHEDDDMGVIFTSTNAVDCSTYLAGLLWDAVQSTVVKAMEGMNWLHACAKKVVASSNVVTWCTPMGLLLQQHYVEYESTRVWLRSQGKRFLIRVPKKKGSVNRGKQAQAIAPNFIHSMDACHLQMTVLKAKEAGISHFTMVHDSYGCPVSQAKLMYKIVRETFVDMYTKHDVLEEFKQSLEVLLDDGDELPPPPVKGELDLDVVKDSKYIFC